MFELYPVQVQAVEEICDGFSRVPVVVLDGPTGSGKTVVGDHVRRRLGVRGLYVCSSKALQDQFCRDFPDAAVLKGRANYETSLYPELFHGKEGLSCADCTWTKESPCDWCEDKHSTCPYERAKTAALGSDCAVLNTAYWLTEANGPGKFAKSELVVVDECDLLEEEVMRYVGCRVTDRAISRYGLGQPQYVTKESSWKVWVDQAVDKLRHHRVKGLQGSLLGPTAQLQAIRAARTLERLTDSLRTVSQGLETGDWIYDGRNGAVEFKAVRVDQLGQGLIWNKSERFLLMSATVISSEQLLRSCGYLGPYETVKMPSTFTKEARRVRVMPVGEVKGDKSDRIVANLAAGIRTVAKQHQGQRILVHTVSFDLATRLDKMLSNGQGTGRVLRRYTSSADRTGTVDSWLDSRDDILMAPSMDRGVDLIGDKCRVQVIAKVPYPYLGDKQVNKRLHGPGGQVWYTVTTVRTIVQMCGRICRDQEDWGVTYILDSSFGKLWRNWRGLFPEWFQEAVVW